MQRNIFNENNVYTNLIPFISPEKDIHCRKKVPSMICLHHLPNKKYYSFTIGLCIGFEHSVCLLIGAAIFTW